MATIRVNGVTQQSGSGLHARKGAPGRKRTRAAQLDAALIEEVGVAFRLGGEVPVEAEDFYDKYAEWDS